MSKRSTRARAALCQPQMCHFSGAGKEWADASALAWAGRQAHTQRHKSIHPTATALSSSRSYTHFCWFALQILLDPDQPVQIHRTIQSSGAVPVCKQRRIWILLYLWLKGFTREGIPFLSAYLNGLQLLWLLFRHLKSDCMMQLVKWQGTKIDVPVKQAVHPGQKTKDCK